MPILAEMFIFYTKSGANPIALTINQHNSLWMNYLIFIARQITNTHLSLFEKKCNKKERETRFELATNSLEGCDSTS